VRSFLSITQNKLLGQEHARHVPSSSNYRFIYCFDYLHGILRNCAIKSKCNLWKGQQIKGGIEASRHGQRSIYCIEDTERGNIERLEFIFTAVSVNMTYHLPAFLVSHQFLEEKIV